MYETVPPVVQSLLETSTGPLGLLVVLVYSLLVATVLPFPGEVVLAVPLDLGFDARVELALLIVASSLGKAAGGLLALHVRDGAVRSNPVVRVYGRVPPWIAERQRSFVRRVGRHGSLGLAAGLAVPLMPDTALIYAFSVVETSPLKFAAAAFVGTVVRLLAVVGLIGGLSALA
ncbi:hypothetical protein ACFQPA_11635 [Halomarina halobia]|uniref:DedA family protein n=1 Tax=Halomarina halobia TaxID=3033386 RepID=A0ABD6AAT0_9EURY|nr:hypothetical protein [Halomarina sp. PSR21]